MRIRNPGTVAWQPDYHLFDTCDIGVVDLFDAHPDSDPTFHFDADPDPDRTLSNTVHMLENQKFF
jgi:hypothetical protein